MCRTSRTWPPNTFDAFRRLCSTVVHATTCYPHRAVQYVKVAKVVVGFVWTPFVFPRPILLVSHSFLNGWQFQTAWKKKKTIKIAYPMYTKIIYFPRRLGGGAVRGRPTREIKMFKMFANNTRSIMLFMRREVTKKEENYWKFCGQTRAAGNSPRASLATLTTPMVKILFSVVFK